MKYLGNSEEITGFRVKIWEREAFKITGYTYIVPPSAGHGPEWICSRVDGQPDAGYSIPEWLRGPKTNFLFPGVSFF